MGSASNHNFKMHISYHDAEVYIIFKLVTFQKNVAKYSPQYQIQSSVAKLSFPPSPPLEKLNKRLWCYLLPCCYVTWGTLKPLLCHVRLDWCVVLWRCGDCAKGRSAAISPSCTPLPTFYTLGRNLHSACFYWFRGSLTPYWGHANKISCSISFLVNTITGTRDPHTI